MSVIKVIKKVFYLFRSTLGNFTRFQVLAFMALVGNAAVMPTEWEDVAMKNGYILQRIVRGKNTQEEICVSG